MTLHLPPASNLTTPPLLFRVDSPTRSVGEHDVAFLSRPLNKCHAGVLLPVTHGLPEYRPLTTWRRTPIRDRLRQWSSTLVLESRRACWLSLLLSSYLINESSCFQRSSISLIFYYVMYLLMKTLKPHTVHTFKCSCG